MLLTCQLKQTSAYFKFIGGQYTSVLWILHFFGFWSAFSAMHLCMNTILTY